MYISIDLYLQWSSNGYCDLQSGSIDLLIDGFISLRKYIHDCQNGATNTKCPHLFKETIRPFMEIMSTGQYFENKSCTFGYKQTVMLVQSTDLMLFQTTFGYSDGRRKRRDPEIGLMRQIMERSRQHFIHVSDQKALCYCQRGQSTPGERTSIALTLMAFVPNCVQIKGAVWVFVALLWATCTQAVIYDF